MKVVVEFVVLKVVMLKVVVVLKVFLSGMASDLISKTITKMNMQFGRTDL